jgi:hypothetical protein
MPNHLNQSARRGLDCRSCLGPIAGAPGERRCLACGLADEAVPPVPKGRPVDPAWTPEPRCERCDELVEELSCLTVGPRAWWLCEMCMSIVDALLNNRPVFCRGKDT